MQDEPVNLDGAVPELARKGSPKRQNDPRDRPKPTGPGPERGSIPGVGWRPRSGRGANGEILVNLDAHPIQGEIFKGVAAPLSVEQMATRWPGYALGFDMHSEAQTILEGLWAERLIPGLAPEDHAKYTGVCTWEEYYDMRALAGSRGAGPSPDARLVINAWSKLNGLGPISDTKPPVTAPQITGPAGNLVGVDARVLSGLEARVDRMEQLLGLAEQMEGLQESRGSAGTGQWSELLSLLVPVLGRYLDGEKLDAMDLLALLPVLRAIQDKRKRGDS